MKAVLFVSAWLAGCAALRTWQPLRELRKQVVPEIELADVYPAHTLAVPVDHFHNDSLYEPHSNDTFALRYWFDASHYAPGGPVILYAAGETSGTNRLPLLQKGIAAQLAQATGGLAVVLEHRYYGASFPVANLSTASLRFLRTEQALADTAYFARHVRFPGLEHVDLTAGAAPWIAYGGSYAGAFVAFLRVLYPDVFWGAISSSGVTVAIHDYWRYFEAQRHHAPPDCVAATQTVLHAADQILLAGRAAQASVRTTEQKPLQPPEAVARVGRLKTAFGLGSVTHDDDFAAVLSEALAGWQSTNWDPALSRPEFGRYCGNATAPRLLYPELEARRADVVALLAATSYADEADALADPVLNFVGWLAAAFPCPAGRTHDACYSNRDPAFYRRDDLTQRWRAWPYQYCTQWGYLATGSGVPDDRLPLVSRLLDLPYLSTICREAFGITAPPDVASINRLGGFGLRYPRLAFIDGEADPWLAATPHAPVGGSRRASTTSEPFLLIGGGAVHHWDSNGLWPNETTADLPPAPIRAVQAQEAAFVRAWLQEWK